MQGKGGRPMLRQLALASFILLTPSMVSAQAANFQIEEATIEAIQAAILRGELTSTLMVQLYLNRIKAYNGTCVNQPDGVLGLGPITPIKNAHQLNALITLNLRAIKRAKLGFDSRKARSMTDPVDDDPAMPDALEVAARQDAYFASTGKLIGPLHGVVFSIKDQYDTFDMRTTAGMDAAYANDRPPRDATFVKRLREAGAIILAKANLGEMGTPNSRSSFGGPFCNPYDTERTPGTSSGGSGSSVGANLVTCSIGEETGGSIHHPAKDNSLVGLAPTQELVSRVGMIGAGLNTRVGPLCRTVKEVARGHRRLRSTGRADRFQRRRAALGALSKLRQRADAEWNADRRHTRAHGQESVHPVPRREHRYRRARHQRSAFTGSHDRRSGSGGRAVSELPRQIRSALSQPDVHRAASGSGSAGRQRQPVDGPHPSARRYVLRSVPCPARYDDPQHQRREQCRADQIHAHPLPAGAQRCEYQIVEGFDRQVEILSGYS